MLELIINLLMIVLNIMMIVSFFSVLLKFVFIVCSSDIKFMFVSILMDSVVINKVIIELILNFKFSISIRLMLNII